MYRKLKITEMGRMTVEQFRESEKLPLTVVLDSVRSLYNVGSVFRSCDAFRVAEVVLCGITATPPNAEIHKTALGAEDSVAWRYFKDTMEAVAALHAEDYTLLAIEQCEGSTMLQDFEPVEGKKYAVVLGNEVKGVQQQVVDACDACIEIPQFGTKHSLNVSVTAGIVIWHFAANLLL
ncbi:MAG: RNA methyltransferase [Bacteroidaceae bacterium]|nr:RNA methyltransferase [Bacteroidaceae bacterium]